VLAKTHESNIVLDENHYETKILMRSIRASSTVIQTPRAHYGKTKYANTIGQLKRSHCGQCQNKVGEIDSIP